LLDKSNPTSSLVVNGIRVETVERGHGRPLLFLHPEIGLDAEAAVLERLAEKLRVIAPTHPGFGGSDLPAWMTSVDDLAYFYLDLLDALDLRGAAIVGVSLGAWIAAAIAIKSTERLSHLILANPVGIKVGDRETRDFVDIFAITQDQVDELAFFDPKLAKRDYQSLPQADALIAARNREATGRFGWSPYLHDPKLKNRLHRVRIPTLVLWGTADRIANESYGRAFCAALPRGTFERIERAGRYPHVEQPEEFARRVLAFTETS